LAPGGITVGTLFHKANQADPCWRDAYLTPFERLIAQANRENAQILEFPRDRIAANGAGASDVAKASVATLEGVRSLEGEAKQPKNLGSLVQTSVEFIAGFTPPDYLIKGILQRRFLYSMTAPTGTGKTCIAMRLAAHVALGLPLGKHQVKQGKVLFMAGENPDDVRMRWIKLCEEMKIDEATENVMWFPGRAKLSDETLLCQIGKQLAALGQISFVIVDTSAAYFEGEDENSNAQLGNHARVLRALVDLPGGPTVVVTCHPTKTPDMDNLVPRGGGAFLAEVDGNLCCSNSGGVVQLHWHGKFRGPDFAPIPFEITAGRTNRLKDSDGELIWTVTARPITDAQQAAAERNARKHQDELMAAMRSNPRASLADLAQAAGWFYVNGEPNKTLAYRIMQELKAEKLAEKRRGQWVLTEAKRSRRSKKDDEPSEHNEPKEDDELKGDDACPF
jgi:AAA domain